MYQNSIPDIINIAQAVLQIFCSQGCFIIQKKEDNSVKYLQNFMKK